MQRMIKCRYCEFSVLPFTRNQNGRNRSGVTRLLRHVEYKHQPEYKAMQDALGEADDREIQCEFA